MNKDTIYFLARGESIEDRLNTGSTNIKLCRKLVTFRRFMNKLLRIPQSTNFKRLDNGVTCIEKNFKNKKVITVSHDIPLRLHFPI